LLCFAIALLLLCYCFAIAIAIAIALALAIAIACLLAFPYFSLLFLGFAGFCFCLLACLRGSQKAPLIAYTILSSAFNYNYCYY